MSSTIKSYFRKLYADATRTKSMEAAQREGDQGHLKRNLHKLDLIAIGVGCTIGAGVFVLTGVAARNMAGPAVCISFLLSGLSIVFSALCYAELASRVPVSGSAYSYTVVTLNEFSAFMIGWNLTLEYTISGAAVSRGWASYFVGFFHGLGVDFPKWMYDIEIGCIGNVCFDANLMALIVGLLIGCVAAFGGKGSSLVNIVVCVITIVVILFCVVGGIIFADTSNWQPFSPFGFDGILKGSALVFFAYVGFDAVACSAEEAANPKTDIAVGMLGSLFIVCVLYTAVSATLTLMVPYDTVDLNAPLAYAFQQHDAEWATVLVSIGSLAALTTTVLTTFTAQSRIFFAMARDGLLPPAMRRVVGVRQVPLISVIVVVVFSSMVGALVDIESLAEMVSIGTLIALSFVCASVLLLRYEHSSKLTSLTTGIIASLVVAAILFRFDFVYASTALFGVTPFATMLYYTFDKRDLKLAFKTPLVPWFPVAGLACNIFLMASLSNETWIRLVIWSVVGVLLYVFYSRQHSSLDQAQVKDQIPLAKMDLIDNDLDESDDDTDNDDNDNDNNNNNNGLDEMESFNDDRKV